MTAKRMYLVNDGGPVTSVARHVPRPERGITELIEDLQPMQEATELPDLFAGLARSVVTTLHADACLVSIYESETGILRDVAASVVPPARLNSIAEEYKVEDFPATLGVLKTGRPMEVAVSDVDADASELELLENLGFSRVLVVRFSIDKNTVGTIEAYRTDDRPFRRDDAKQIDILASFAANTFSRIQLAARLEVHYTETIEALVSALEARDPYTQAHAGRIRDSAVAISVAMQVPLEQRRAIRLGSILHDVGKIGVSDSILLKAGPLTDEEWAIMRTHPEIGERMLQGIDFLTPALPIVRHHHERWDGKGYPDKLAGEEIPIGARIVAVCDAFDAMTSDRPYRQAMSIEDACEELRREAGTQFDPKCVDLLVEIVSEMGSEGQSQLEERFVRYAS
jgi:HD-GYP domain-containing protein (c-di-GMP phosphodiesterase class II)